ncbi:hypothetical protein BTA51_09270 [Hahella sp. CCB-MM4]|uniref:CSLREA domain-containing protein n=1 Tax=Hahella sp. (strain CCB-MM4) TaxID=1926491 RepID=UPI000B9AF170|nr:CSLREA domain-containing protein [Hahella sp. CCB-MM4]OZG73959.1 hypothetical protein BTA51_09270 [Hahella sp. CCB-MM4]
MKHLKMPVFILLSLFADTGYAQTIEVTKFTDTFDGTCDEDCSLREAITLANQSPGLDRIYLDAGSYTLEIPPEPDDWEFIDENNNVRDDFDITDDIEIIGVSMEDTIVKNTTRGWVFHVVNGNVWFERLSIVDGDTPYKGGGLLNSGDTVLYRCKLYSNAANERVFTNNPVGGGAANNGTLRVYSSQFLENSSSGGDSGGFGGGIYNDGNLMVRDSLFKSNETSGYYGVGAAIYNRGSADIRRSMFYQNHTWSHSDDADGTAIKSSYGGQLKIVSSTFAENYGDSPWMDDFPVDIATISSRGKLWITHSTIVNNEGAGVALFGDSYIKNTLMAHNGLEYDYNAHNCFSQNGDKLTSLGLLLGAGWNAGCMADIEINDATTFTELLEPVTGHERFGVYYRPRSESLAIDAAESPCPRYDQLGQETGFDGDNDGVDRCDLGAVEWRP